LSLHPVVTSGSNRRYWGNDGIHSRKHAPPGQAMSDTSDFRLLDDAEFLASRARLRTRLEHTPDNAVGRDQLERLYNDMTYELDRRARASWTPAG
jgi:hypothetical protein